MTPSETPYLRLRSKTTPLIAPQSFRCIFCLASNLRSLIHSLQYPPYQIFSNTFLTLIRPVTKFKHLLRLLTFILTIQIISSLAWADEPASNTIIDNADLRLFGGYSWYYIEEFNKKVEREGNKTIDGGLNDGIELLRESEF